MDAASALSAWSWTGTPRLHPAESGLINQTYLVVGDAGPQAVLQRLNTEIFPAVVHEDIEAVTRHLAARGLDTPLLRRTRQGRLWHESPAGEVWRVLSWVGDRTVEQLASEADARAAGALVARFHEATADLDWEFRSVRGGGFHDTDRRMQMLRDALRTHADHRLRGEVSPVAEAVLKAWADWDGPTDLRKRIVHGDLKISNVRFAGSEAVALIDLDTLARGTLDAELGDAFRSWCNRSREDEVPHFDLELFSASVRGYSSRAAAVTAEEWSSIVPGVVRITLELAARFAADALNESYFAFDATRFSSRGAHNLARASAQLALAREVHGARRAAEALVRAAKA